VSLSARAQAPLHGLKTGYVAATYTGEVGDLRLAG
jgi:hypothetical protein